MKNTNALLTMWTAPADTCSLLDVFSAFGSSFDTQWHSCISRKDKREGEEREGRRWRVEGGKRGRGREKRAGEDGVQEEEGEGKADGDEKVEQEREEGQEEGWRRRSVKKCQQWC